MTACLNHFRRQRCDTHACTYRHTYRHPYTTFYCTYVHTNTDIHTHTHTHTHKHTHTHPQTHTHTHTQRAAISLDISGYLFSCEVFRLQTYSTSTFSSVRRLFHNSCIYSFIRATREEENMFTSQTKCQVRMTEMIL